MGSCADAGACVEADAGDAILPAPIFMLACVPSCADTAPCVRARADGYAGVRTGAVVLPTDGDGVRERG